MELFRLPRLLDPPAPISPGTVLFDSETLAAAVQELVSEDSLSDADRHAGKASACPVGLAIDTRSTIAIDPRSNIQDKIWIAAIDHSGRYISILQQPSQGILADIEARATRIIRRLLVETRSLHGVRYLRPSGASFEGRWDYSEDMQLHRLDPGLMEPPVPPDVAWLIREMAGDLRDGESALLDDAARDGGEFYPVLTASQRLAGDALREAAPDTVALWAESVTEFAVTRIGSSLFIHGLILSVRGLPPGLRYGSLLASIPCPA